MCVVHVAAKCYHQYHTSSNHTYVHHLFVMFMALEDDKVFIRVIFLYFVKIKWEIWKKKKKTPNITRLIRGEKKIFSRKQKYKLRKIFAFHRVLSISKRTRVRVVINLKYTLLTSFFNYLQIPFLTVSRRRPTIGTVHVTVPHCDALLGTAAILQHSDFVLFQLYSSSLSFWTHTRIHSLRRATTILSLNVPQCNKK